MYGIMSGLEPRGYANGDLVQKALQLGVQPFGMSDEEIMQAISQKQQVDDMSGASGYTNEVSADGEGYKMFGKDGLIFDPSNPLDYLLAVPGAGMIAGGIKALNTGNKLRKIKKGADVVSKANNPYTRGIATGAIAADIALDPEMQDIAKDIFANDALDDAAEDLEIVNANEEEEKPDEEKSFDKMKGLAAFAEFASQLGTSPGDTPQMTGGQFIRQNPFEAPGVMRMADGGIAQLADGGRVAALKAGIKGLANRLKPKKKTKTKKKTDKEKETAISKDAPEGDSFIPPEVAYLAGKGKEILGKIPAMQNPKRVAARTALYGTPLAMGVSALLPDKPPIIPPTGGADGGGDKDVLDGESLKDIHYARSMARAQEAGRDKPTFMDYVASFPGSYTDKLSKDPEFAQQMMAGFVAMMTPTEGIVERSGFADFAGGVMAEQARQEGEVPDQIKLIEAVSENPELLEAYKGFQKATKPQTFEELQNAAKLIEGEIKESLYKKAGSKKPVLRKGSQAIGKPEPLNAFTLYEMFEKEGGDSAALAKVIAQVEGVI